MLEKGLIGTVNLKIYDVVTWETYITAIAIHTYPIYQKVKATRQ